MAQFGKTSATTSKSAKGKVISSKEGGGVKGGKGKMFGKQSVKAAKAK